MYCEASKPGDGIPHLTFVYRFPCRVIFGEDRDVSVMANL
jgi:hypothetical protein